MQSFQSALEQQNSQLELLAALLDQELHLISTRNAEDLMNLLQKKEQTLDAIQESDAFLNKHYQVQLADTQPPEEVEKLTTQVRKTLEQCQYQTQINQRAVEQGQLRLTHLRNLMLEVRAKESLTYDKSGKPNSGRSGSGIQA